VTHMAAPIGDHGAQPTTRRTMLIGTGTASLGIIATLLPSARAAGSHDVPGVSVAAAPNDLVGAAEDSRVDLTWTAPEGVLTGYLLQRRFVVDGEPDGAWEDLATIPGSPPPTTYRDRSLANGTQAVYRVAAQNSAGTGPASTTSEVLTPQDAAIGGERAFVLDLDGTLYRVHEFSSVGVATLEMRHARGIRYLIVGGGGGGASRDSCGGGGAGGVITNLLSGDALMLGAGDTRAVTVGAGGSGGSSGASEPGSDGSPTQFEALIAAGGGGGGTWDQVVNGDGRLGGSGGGAGRSRGSGGGAATTGQGNRGGDGSGTNARPHGGGGGGGAGAQGASGAIGVGGNGGSGIDLSGHLGTAVGAGGWFAGGGGGTIHRDDDFPASAAGAGGSGGGGDGGGRNLGVVSASDARSHGRPGVAGTGGGGGAARGLMVDAVLESSVGSPGGSGGSGVVLIRYEIEPD
jgi:hypothetical protein